jgi:primary-amine oxidase
MMTTTAERATAVRHLLDPLTADEIETATRILRQERGLGESARFVYVTLREPAKDAVLSYQPGEPIDRQADVVIRERAEHKTYEAVVSLTAGEVRLWQELDGIQPAVMLEEFLATEEAVRKDPRWQEAMRKRGITDFDMAMIDPWSVGYGGPEDAASEGRFLRPLTWVRQGDPEDHGYARPVEGLIVRFDLDRMEVVDIEDHGAIPLPPNSGNYTSEAIRDPGNVPHFPDGDRQDLKPVEITQPEGTSFTVDGHEVSWQKWRFQVGFTPREGLVLYLVRYEDHGTVRPVIYRASLTEMVIPYGDPSPAQYRKNVFDMGEYGIGVLANSLELGCDCLGEIRYFDAWLNDNDGHAQVIKNAICLHEEDHGMLWKHTDWRTGKAEVRRSRRLVISMIATVGNYEYGYFWYLYQDGTIEYEVKLTGVISNAALPPGEKPTHGTLVAPQVYGPNHQHIFCVRLDMMVDGPQNTVVECDSVAVPPGPENPYGNAWVVQQAPLRSESQAQRVADGRAARYWKITNPGKLNATGEAVAYKLVPQDAVLPFWQPDTSIARRAGFANKHLWVTAYDPGQRFPAGEYPNQHPGGDGLPTWTEADRPLENTDVVLWHTFTAHHTVRPEDWPVMPVTRAGFQLRAHGFFDGNPALDVPPPEHCQHQGEAADAMPQTSEPGIP